MKTTIRQEAIIIFKAWTDMWNGELDKADLIIENGFRPHLLIDKYGKEDEINNAEKVKDWVKAIRGSFKSLTYAQLAGPFTDETESVTCFHWKATGVFAGKTGLPIDIPGKDFLIEGTDILKFWNGKIYECWTQSGVVMKS
ncbi:MULTISPECIES: hypothetical protein [Chitinophagaceae]